MIKRAHELDPLSSAISDNVSAMYQRQNNQNASIENSLKAIELDPTYSGAYDLLGMSYLKQGRNAEAIVNLEKSVELSKTDSNALSDLGYGYGVTGNARKHLRLRKSWKGSMREKNQMEPT